MHKQKMNFPKTETKGNSAAGVGILELLIVIALVGVVSALAITSFQKSRRSFDVAGATRNLSTYLEKARIDSVRRHGVASVTINSQTSYTANIDFSGNGTATARTITLPAGTTLSYRLPPATTSINPSTTPITIAYDWRGRTTAIVAVIVSDSTAGVSPTTLVVGLAGDVSSDTYITGPVTTPTPQDTTVTTTTGIKSMR